MILTVNSAARPGIRGVAFTVLACVAILTSGCGLLGVMPVGNGQANEKLSVEERARLIRSDVQTAVLFALSLNREKSQRIAERIMSVVEPLIAAIEDPDTRLDENVEDLIRSQVSAKDRIYVTTAFNIFRRHYTTATTGELLDEDRRKYLLAVCEGIRDACASVK